MENWEKHWVDYYLLLGILPTADVETVLAVYRRQARRYAVPGGTDPDESKYRLLNDAKDILLNENKRMIYDRAYEAHIGQPETPPFEEGSATHWIAKPASNRKRVTFDSISKFVVTVDRSMDLESLIRASGFSFSYGSTKAIANFHRQPSNYSDEPTVIELVRASPRRQSLNDFLADLHDSGNRPIDVVELLSLAVQHASGLRRHSYILALHDPWTVSKGKFIRADGRAPLVGESGYALSDTPLYAYLHHSDNSTRQVGVSLLEGLHSLQHNYQYFIETLAIGVTRY